jgi:hypothetical protein
MALAVRSVARATAPHLPTLSATLTPLLAVANAGSFHLRYQTGAVVIEQASFAGCDLAAIDAAVAAAPAPSDQLDAQAWIDNMPIPYKAICLALIDQLNTLRAFHSLSAITPAQAIAAVRTKAGTL